LRRIFQRLTPINLAKMINLNLLNHFEKFSLVADFDLDVDLLENKYLQLQKEFHPDSNLNSNQDSADLNSIAVNEAYKILKNPLKRAVYLLKLNGINIEDDNCEVKPEQETLMLILELKEKLFGSDDADEALQIKDFATKEIKNLMKEIKTDFKNKQIKNAAQKLIKVKYLDKILQDLKLKNQQQL
jgi:molecular chaperone HscB